MNTDDSRPLVVYVNPGATRETVMAQFRTMITAGPYRARVAQNGIVLAYPDGRKVANGVYNHPEFGDALGQIRAGHCVTCDYDSPVG